MKKLLRQLVSLDRRIASLEGSLVVADNPVEGGCTVQAEHTSSAGEEGRHPVVVEENRPAGDKESLVAVGDMALLAVVACIVRLVVEGNAVDYIQAEGKHTQIHPEKRETV
jgi:hypothetical protein